MKQLLLDTAFAVRRHKDEALSLLRWQLGGFEVPPPAAVKRRVLRRHGIRDAPWLETGTGRGTTAAYLASFAPSVITLEPMPDLFVTASTRLRRRSNVEVRNVSSEEGFAAAANTLGPRINFWLDGHYSGGGTFEGSSDTPVLHELEIISGLLRAGAQVATFIDDARLFAVERSEIPSRHRSGYPPLSTLVSWAQDNGLNWVIEHDIFIARTMAPVQ
jgi:hypothetical protein